MTKQMTITPEELADRLYDIIMDKGMEHLSEHPWSVYDELKDKVSPALARAVLSTILADIHNDAKSAAEAKAKKDAKQGSQKGAKKGVRKLSPESLAADIRERCLLNTETADFLAVMYRALFSEDNLADWQDFSWAGFRELCSEEIKYHYHGEISCVDSDEEPVDCAFDIEVVYRIQDPDTALSLVWDALDSNPSAAAEELRKIINDELGDSIECSLEACYEYWETEGLCSDPLEDFNDCCREDTEQYLKENGLRLLKYECNVSEFEDEPDDGPVIDEDDWRSLVVWKKAE